ncbi:hypothetical protein [Enterococcus phage Bp29]|uniref:Uncharacterized protein n=1 Tax=Enterococcus phage vB_EfaS-DELF1 TaxID=2683673 RepID=A0A5S9MMZ6_9CAUD|nr:hypothetical protein [Enterococcus phage Bp29]BBQ04325.1 hypothetical protein [Enterococcus phage vB_EfaS-DELF1]
MLKQLNSGMVIDISNTDSMNDLFTLEQLEVLEAIIDFKNNEIYEIKDELDNVENLLKTKESNINDLRKYIKRYGFKNERKIIEKIDNI